MMMAAGAIIFVISCLGCSGACQESKCLLTLYGILLATILLLEITAVGLAMVYKGKAEEKTRNFLQSTIKSYYKPDRSNDTNAVTVMWNVLMAEMSCCGVDNYLDFNSSPSFKENSTQVVPQACCVLIDKKKINPKFPNCTQSPSSVNSYYMSGCYERVRNWVMDHINIVIYVIIAVILIELLSVFLAFCLCMSIGRYDK